MTMVILVDLACVPLSKLFLFFGLTGLAPTLIFAFHVNMVIWFVIKKGEFIDPILMKCKVLMITNTNVIYA